MTMKTTEQYRKCFEMHPVHSAIAFLRHGTKPYMRKSIGSISDAEKLFIVGMRLPYDETSLERMQVHMGEGNP